MNIGANFANPAKTRISHDRFAVGEELLINRRLAGVCKALFALSWRAHCHLSDEGATEGERALLDETSNGSRGTEHD